MSDDLTTATPPDRPRSALGKRIRWWAWQGFASFVWFYILIKLFVFDIDNYLFARFFPNASWLLAFKFFFIIGIVAALILFQGRFIIFWIIYLLLYPLVVIFWKVPHFIFKQENWVLAFAIAHSVLVFCRSFASNFVTLAIGLIAAAIALASSAAPYLWIASVLLLAITIVMYVRRFLSVFRSTFAPEIYQRMFRWSHAFILDNNKVDEKIRSLPILNLSRDELQTLNKTDVEAWKTGLTTFVLFNRFSLFFAKKLRAYQRSGFPLVANSLTLISLVFVTIVSFACINSALFHIDSHYFEAPNEPSFFTFVWYSFNALVFNSVKELAPAAPVAQSVWMTEGLLAFFLAVILASLLFSHRSKREAEELNDVIANIESEGRAMEASIKTIWHIDTVDQALAELTKVEASLLKLMLFFSDRIK